MSSTTEEIHFTENHEINRTMPTILSKNGRMPLQGWNNFCDQVDNALKPLRIIKPISTTISCLFIMFIVLCSTGWIWVGDENFSAYYGAITPLFIVLLIAKCHVESRVRDKVSSSLMKACATASNHDKDLTIVPKTSGEIYSAWCIEVTLLNNYNGEDIEATPVAVATAAINVPIMASAPVPVPVAVASAVASSTSTTTAQPKKYIKDEETGAMTLNPEYKQWMNERK